MQYICIYFGSKTYFLLTGRIATSRQIILLVGGGQKSNKYIGGGDRNRKNSLYNIDYFDQTSGIILANTAVTTPVHSIVQGWHGRVFLKWFFSGFLKNHYLLCNPRKSGFLYFFNCGSVDTSENLFDSNILLPKVLNGVIVISTTHMVQISLLFLNHFRAIKSPSSKLGTS